MHALSIDELESHADAFDEAVARTPEIDRFCASSAWILPAARALMPPRESFIHKGEHGWLAAMLGRSEDGLTFAEPLEHAWQMACPLIGADPQALAEEVAHEIASRGDWRLMVIAGLPPNGALLPALLRALPRGMRRGIGPASIRRIASLEGGVDGFLARRTRNFRKALRASARDAATTGITFEPAFAATDSEASALYARILAVEAKSWKAHEGAGIDQGPMRDFYADMLPRLARRGRLRAWFARGFGRDLAYVFGAVFDGGYRGLQFSYDRDFARHSLGSLLQLRQIEALVAEGVRRYDLGQDLEYKRRWSDEAFETVPLLVMRS